ncbi:MAG: hypothetical protein ROZ09_15220 [Thiobacillus sp.]|nr:hypothetical protein [Thiobacillus sp.]MDT3708171.1 hypothetical protein [Thiobacillus sp.]
MKTARDGYRYDEATHQWVQDAPAAATPAPQPKPEPAPAPAKKD